MAQLVQRDHYSIRKENIFIEDTQAFQDCTLHSRDVDPSRIKDKENFLHSLGLRMKNHKVGKEISKNPKKLRRIHMAHRITMFRDCRVVILGTKCNVCGKCFKCETDLNVHTLSEHCSHKGKDDKNQCEMISGSSDQTKNSKNRRGLGSTLKKKLRLTLKIGEEIVAKMSVKRKHLISNTVNMYTQTETPSEIQMVEIIDDEVSSSIDPELFDDNPHQSYNLTVDRVNSSNRYLASNIAVSKQSVGADCTEPKENYYPYVSSDKFLSDQQSLCVTEIHTLFNKNIKKDKEESNIFARYNDVRRTKNILKFNEDIVESGSNLRRKSVEIRDDRIDIVRGTDINANEIELNICNEEFYKKFGNSSNTAQLITPVILPIILPNKDNSSLPIRLTIRSGSTQRRSNELDGRKKGYFREEDTEIIEDYDDEIQEIL